MDGSWATALQSLQAIERPPVEILQTLDLIPASRSAEDVEDWLTRR